MYFFVCMSILHLVLKTCSRETKSTTLPNTTPNKPAKMPLQWNILLVVVTAVAFTMLFLACWHKRRRGLVSSSLRTRDPTESMPPELESSAPESEEITYAEPSFQARMQTKTAAASYRIKGKHGVEYAELRYPQQHTVHHN